VNITAIGTVVDDVSGGVGPYTYTLNSPAVGTYGTLTFNPDGSYRYILERPYDSQPDADDGRNPEDNREQFAYTVTDAAGNTVQGFIFIDIIDDVPTAYSNTRTAIEGADLGGNVLSDGPVADVFGADGPTAGGGVVGVRLAGSDTTTAVTGGTGTTILGQFGTLVLNADGTYIYNGTPNSVGVNGGSDVFVYTIQDGDGDRSTTTLTINVTDSGLATVNDNSGVKEGALPFGSVPNPVNITAIGTVVDDVSGGVGPYTYTLNSPAVGTYGTLTFNPDGSYRYILERPYDSQPDADDGRNPEDNREQFAYTVTDAAGNTVQGFIFIDIIDDIPIASSDVDSVREDGPLLATGNVVTGTDIAGSDANDSDGVADLAGADGLGSVIWTGAVGSTVAGSFGTLTVGADGGYSYALDNDDAAVQRLNENQSLSETFEYTIVDGDGDRSTATLTINVLGANDDAPQLVVIDNKPGTVIGGSNDDVLIGDLGGVQTGAIPGQNYNIALVVDVSLSMQPRMELLKESLNNLLDALKDHDGSINITLISFSDTARELATVTGLNSVNVESLISAVNGLQASGYTNYESAFNTAINWFSDTSNANPGHIDQTYFVTDGDPTRHLDANGNVAGSGSTTSFTTLDNSVSSFAGLAAISQVSAIGIGEGVNSNYLRFFDTTSTTGVGSVSLGGTSWTALADFNNPGSTGLNSTAGWSTGGGTGTVSISNDYLRLQEVRQSSGAQTASTFTSTNIAVVEGGAVRFDYRSENGNSSDVVQWRLLRADGSIADSGSISATQSSSGEITTDTLSAGSYRLQFVLQDNSSSNALGLRIDNIELGAPQTVTGPVGEPQIVQTAEELSAVLIRGSTTSEELPVSSDVLVGGDGDDLLFGDTLYTDNLPGSHPDGSGFEVIESMLGKDYDNPADRADIYDYIKDNVDILTRPSDPRGGDDTIIGGQGNDLMFGQGGSDTFVFRLADKGTAAVPAIDTIADFNTAAVDAGGDVLDLRDLLQGESGTAVSLDNFLSFNVSGGNTTISVSSTPGGAVEQQITLTGVDLSAGGTLNSDAAIIQNLLNGNKLVTDGG
jgi:VCBS repeat-containing protein